MDGAEFRVGKGVEGLTVKRAALGIFIGVGDTAMGRLLRTVRRGDAVVEGAVDAVLSTRRSRESTRDRG